MIKQKFFYYECSGCRSIRICRAGIETTTCDRLPDLVCLLGNYMTDWQQRGRDIFTKPWWLPSFLFRYVRMRERDAAVECYERRNNQMLEIHNLVCPEDDYKPRLLADKVKRLLEHSRPERLRVRISLQANG